MTKAKEALDDWRIKYPIGSQWKCRDGSRAVVVGHEDNGSNITIYAFHQNTGGLFWYYKDGKVDDYDVKFDLIEPWKEPRVIEKEIFMYERPEDGKAFITEAKYDLCKIIARKRITITEGEGL